MDGLEAINWENIADFSSLLSSALVASESIGSMIKRGWQKVSAGFSARRHFGNPAAVARRL
jgi:hypothetical protein